MPLHQLLALRLAVGLWILIPAAGVRIPEGQPIMYQAPALRYIDLFMKSYFAMMECGFQCYFAERVQLGQLAKAVKNGLAYIKFRFVCCPLKGGAK